MASKRNINKREIKEVYEEDVPRSNLSSYEENISVQISRITQTINNCSRDVKAYGSTLERELDAFDCLLTNILPEYYQNVLDVCENAKKKLKTKYGNAGFGRVFWNAYLPILIKRHKFQMKALGLGLSASTDINWDMVFRKKQMEMAEKEKNDRRNHKKKGAKAK